MLKLTIFCALMALLSAQYPPNWVGIWKVIQQNSSLLTTCNVPLVSTVVNISEVSPGVLNLQGYGAGNLQTDNWQLEWNATDLNPSFCEDDFCASGFFIWEKKVKWAKISWNVSTSTVEYCDVIIAPTNVSWVGEWLVVASGSTGLNDCDVPKGQTVANITAADEGLLLSGTELLNGNPANWTLNWQANQLKVSDSCSGSLCVNANLTVIDGAMSGRIYWNQTSSNNQCQAVLARLEQEELEEDPAIVFETYEKLSPLVAFINEIESLKDIVTVNEAFGAANPTSGKDEGKFLHF